MTEAQKYRHRTVCHNCTMTDVGLHVTGSQHGKLPLTCVALVCSGEYRKIPRSMRSHSGHMWNHQAISKATLVLWSLPLSRVCVCMHNDIYNFILTYKIMEHAFRTEPWRKLFYSYKLVYNLYMYELVYIPSPWPISFRGFLLFHVLLPSFFPLLAEKLQHPKVLSWDLSAGTRLTAHGCRHPFGRVYWSVFKTLWGPHKWSGIIAIRQQT